MLIFSLRVNSDLENSLVSILDTAKLRGENAIVIMTDRKQHMTVFDFFLKHKAIKRIKISASTYFIIKEMRIELKPIDYYL